MLKYREILRLASMGISQRNIAYSCGCGQSTVSDILKAAKPHGVEWPLPDEMDDKAIRLAIYPEKNRKSKDKAAIDHERTAEELKRRGMTMSLLWNEYCGSALAQGKEPYMYSAFCMAHREWARRNDVRMHIEHRPAEQIQVDWVGDTGEVIDPDSGEILKIYVFAACLPYSNYLYAEGFYRTDEEAWVSAHVHMFTFFKGSTPILTPDNTRTAVTKNTKDELIVNEQYRRMSEHYGCAVVPTRVRRPRDKGSIEMGVGVIERQAMMALRHRRFMSLADYNRALLTRVMAINSRPFQKREGSRDSIYSDQEKPMLIPLPPHPYEIVTRKEATVNFNYHVSFDGVWYSVPFHYVKRVVSVSATDKTVAIACDGKRIAMHERGRRQGDYRTNPDHMPDAHRDFAEWNGDRFRRWAAEVGDSTETVIDAILRSRKVEQQSYRSCRGVLALGRNHGNLLLEEACQKTLLLTPRPSYKTVKAMITDLARDRSEANDDEHAYLRGSDYYRELDGPDDERSEVTGKSGKDE